MDIAILLIVNEGVSVNTRVTGAINYVNGKGGVACKLIVPNNAVIVSKNYAIPISMKCIIFNYDICISMGVNTFMSTI
jgi:hypothetical protein